MPILRNGSRIRASYESSAMTFVVSCDEFIDVESVQISSGDRHIAGLMQTIAKVQYRWSSRPVIQLTYLWIVLRCTNSWWLFIFCIIHYTSIVLIIFIQPIVTPCIASKSIRPSVLYWCSFCSQSSILGYFSERLNAAQPMFLFTQIIVPSVTLL